MKKKAIFRITFINQEKIYEVYARSVLQKDFFGFVVLEDLIFGETSSIVVDPGQERLKNEFQDVKRTHIPLHSIIRIDEVEKEGVPKITSLTKESNISPFPPSIYTKTPDKLS